MIPKLAKKPEDIYKLIAGMNEVVAVTYLVVSWIEKYHNNAEYKLIIKKARAWLKKEISKENIDETKLKGIECV